MSKQSLKPLASHLDLLSPKTPPHTTRGLRLGPLPRSSDPSAAYSKSLTTRHSDKVFFPPSLLSELPSYEPSRCSVKSVGVVKAYAANTNQGLFRTYNEDRVSIILNIVKPPSRSSETWPKCSFFGVYDGHGGAACADYLRDNLHQFVIAEAAFPSNPREALKQGFANAERQFLEAAIGRGKNSVEERSGSCAVVALLVGDQCYIANVGDSRVIMSAESGRKVFVLSTDHKPSEDGERKRIVEAGGKIYQTQLVRPEGGETVLGPHRVLPGRLSVVIMQVSRTFGDAEAKLARFGGNPGVIVAVPDVRSFRVTGEQDFIILACDGIFDKMSSREAVQAAWSSLRERSGDVHSASGRAVEAVMQLALQRRTLDNVTVVLVALPGLRLHDRPSLE